MLVLTRRPTESLIIGDGIRITVLGMKGCQVRLGIEAPREMRVDREEIRVRKDQEIIEALARKARDCTL